MKFIFLTQAVLSLMFVEILLSAPHAEAFTGLKSTYREGQPGWRRMRQNAAKRRRIEARAERLAKAALNKPEERTGIQRYAFDYWYPTSMTAIGLIDSAKKAMEREHVNRLVVVITANGEDQFSWFVSKKTDGTFDVTGDTVESAALARVPFLPHSSGLQFREVEEHDDEKITVFGWEYTKPNERMVGNFLFHAEVAMEIEKLDRVIATVTEEGEETYTYLLFRNNEGKIVVGGVDLKSAAMARVELALTMLSCEGLAQ